MPLWKKIVLTSIGFGAGFAVVLCVVVGIFVWYQQRPKPPKPWDRQTITAEFDRLDTQGADNDLVFVYSLQNNADEDFRLDSDVGVNLSAKLQEQKEFAQFSQTTLSLKYPIFVPAKHRVRLSIESKFKYPFPALKADAPKDERKQYRDAIARYVGEELSNLDGFVVFDTINRYEIDFPSGWEKESDKKSSR